MMNLILVKREGMRRRAGGGAVYPGRRGWQGPGSVPTLQGHREQNSELWRTQGKGSCVCPCPSNLPLPRRATSSLLAAPLMQPKLQ